MKLVAPREEVAAWLRRARIDLEMARLAVGRPGLAALGGFHCQQAVEKCLKAVLAAAGEDVPRTHDLPGLAQRARTHVRCVLVADADLHRLRLYAVAPRHPGFADDDAERDLAALLAVAGAVLDAIEAELAAAAGDDADRG